jgi:hypothetical protein
VSRHMFAEILSLIPRRQGKACVDADQPAYSSASVPARTRFDRPFARTDHDLSLLKPVKRSILARNRREFGECRFL